MHRSTCTTLLLALVGLCTPGARADESVVPGAYTATAGTATFLGPLSNATRHYQWLIHADQLTSLIGQDITGVAFRNTSGSTTAWPATAVDFSSYELLLSEGVPPANRNTADFSANVVGTQTLVRSGPLHIDPLVYPVTTAPHPFGPTIDVTPWHYTGGHLLMELRSSGFSGTSRSVDAIGTSTAGYGTQFSAMWSSNLSATGGAQGNFVIVKFTTTQGGGGGCNLADIAAIGGLPETPGDPDGQLTVDDLIVFVGLFSDSTGCPGTAPCNRADVTGVGGFGAPPDGQLTVDDLIEFVNAFSNGC